MKGPVHGRAVALNLGGTLPPPDYTLYYRVFREDDDATGFIAAEQ